MNARIEKKVLKIDLEHTLCQAYHYEARARRCRLARSFTSARKADEEAAKCRSRAQAIERKIREIELKQTFEQAKKRYNEIQLFVGNDYLVIGSKRSEYPENLDKWNLANLVDECEYQAALTAELMDASADGEQEKRRRELIAFVRFINRYKPVCRENKISPVKAFF